MYEINKLRTRLKNIQRNVTEYRMTVTEAQDLLKEIDDLLTPKLPEEIPVVESHPTLVRILDGGTF